MSTVDNRVVSMTFDNDQFERKMSETIKSLDGLKKSLDFSNSKKSFDDLTASSNKFDLSSMARGIESITGKLGAMGAVGFSIIQGLTTNFLTLAKTIAGKVWDPLMEGGKQRALNIEQAKFLFRGLGMDVDQSMQDALAAVKGTAYGLDEAAKIAAQFGASGIQGGAKMTGALRGVAGAAAMTGSTFSEIGQIFAQSAASGKVTTMDLQQFASRGLNVAASLGKVLGKTEAEVRQMASSGKLDFKTFSEAMDQAFGEHATKANETYKGSLANVHAAMSRLGAAIQGPHLEQMRDIFNTLSPIIDDVTTALKPLIEAFTNINRIQTNALIEKLKALDLSKFTQAISNFASSALNLFVAFYNVLKPITAAFKEVFSPNVAGTVLSMSENFKSFTEALRNGTVHLEGVKTAFKAVFQIMDIGWTITKGLVGVFISLVGALAHIVGGFGGAAGGVAAFIDGLHETLVAGGGIQQFFENITGYISKLGPIIDSVKEKFSKIFGGDKGIPGAEGVSNVVGRVSTRLDQLGGVVKTIGNAFIWLGEQTMKLIHALDPFWDYIGRWATELKDRMAKVFKPGDFDTLLDGINTGLLGGLVLILRNFMKNGLSLNIGGKFMDSVTGMFDQLTGTLKAMQTQIKADALIKIAIAMAVLTASIVVLSLIDSASLTKSLVAIGVGFTELVGVFAMLDKISTGTSAAKFTTLAVGLGILSVAMLILSIAIKNLAGLSWGELAVGLTGVAGAIVIMAGAVKIISSDSGGMIKAGIGMIAISTAMLVMSKAVESFAAISWGDMLHGFVGVAVGLGLVALAVNLMPKDMVSKGVGLVIISTGLLILEKAVSSFGGMDWATMGKGFVGIAGGLLIMAGAMQLMPPNMILTAAGILIVSIALNVMAKAVQAMSSMDFGTMAKGIGGLAVMLLLLVVATNAMSGAIVGAAALIIVSGALLILAHVLEIISGISWGDLIKGLVAIAAVLAVLGIAALVMEPVIPALLALGVALGVVGVAIALFGVGAFLLAKAFEVMAESGAAGAKALVSVLETIGSALPKIAQAVAGAVIDFFMSIVDAAPVLLKGLGVILGLLLDMIIELVPKLAEAVYTLFHEIINVTVKLTPEIVQAGITMILALLEGIRDNIEEITTIAIEILVKFVNTLAENMDLMVGAAVNLIVSFINALSENLTLIIAAGVNLIVQFIIGIGQAADQILQAATWLITTFITGLATTYILIAQAGTDALIAFLTALTQDAVRIANAIGTLITTFVTEVGKKTVDIAKAATDALVAFLEAMTEDVTRISNAVGNLIVAIIVSIGNNMDKIVTAGAHTIVQFIHGLDSNLSQIITAGTQLIIHLIQGIGQSASQIADAGMRTILEFVQALTRSIETYSGQLRTAGKDMAFAIADGLSGGLLSKAGEIKDKVVDMVGGALDAAKGFLGIGSPSKEFMKVGKDMVAGMVVALDSDTTAESSVEDLANRVTAAFQDSLSTIPMVIEGMDEFNPTITPVLDLTGVQKDAKALTSFLAVQPLQAELSLSQANLISHTTDTRPTETPPPTPAAPTEVSFEQNIYSPTALSANDIYRNTRSQIALAKEELSIP